MTDHPDEPPFAPIDGEDDVWAHERALFEEAWDQIREDGDGSRRSHSQEIAHALDVLIDAFKSILATDSLRQWEDLARRFLIALKQLIDAALEWLDRDQKRVEVEDIPID